VKRPASIRSRFTFRPTKRRTPSCTQNQSIPNLRAPRRPRARSMAQKGCDSRSDPSLRPPNFLRIYCKLQN
jgi:hypothetical protein